MNPPIVLLSSVAMFVMVMGGNRCKRQNSGLARSENAVHLTSATLVVQVTVVVSDVEVVEDIFVVVILVAYLIVVVEG